MRVVFLGTPQFACAPLKSLIDKTEVIAVYSQPDKPVGRGLKLKSSPVKQMATDHGIPVFTPEKISVPEEVERLKAFHPDFIVVVAYGQILKLPVIQAPKYGTVNIHSSLLPRWRGAAPIQWSILGGDSETGVSTMMIAPKLDAGDILLQEKIPILPEDTAESIHDKLSILGANLIFTTLKGLYDGTLRGRVQNESEVTYAHKLTKEMEIIDWKKTSREIDLQVRSLCPWPGTRLETEAGLRIKIKKGRPLSHSPIRITLGDLQSVGGELVLGCQDGGYQILELQEEGKKTITGHDFLNSCNNKKLSLPIPLKTINTLGDPT